MWRRTQNDDRGSLYTGEVKLEPGDPVVIRGEDRPRRVTYVMGSERKGWRACFRGQGAVPTGAVRWRVAEATAPWGAQTGSPAPTSSWTPAFSLAASRAGAPVLVTGFDSAWTPQHVGALTSCVLGRDGLRELRPPGPATFEEAVQCVEEVERRTPGFSKHVVVVDQPLVVPNLEGCRPVDRALSMILARHGGGVQPANRSRAQMFGDGAPIWAFLGRIRGSLDPRDVHTGPHRRVVVEGFPALALLGLFPVLRQRGSVARYNPQRSRTFRPEDWTALCEGLERSFSSLGAREASRFCRAASQRRPRKADQDALDALICLLVGLHLCIDPAHVFHIGDLQAGYVVTPADPGLEDELRAAAARTTIPVAPVAPEDAGARGSPRRVIAAVTAPSDASDEDVDRLVEQIARGRGAARFEPLFE